MADENTESGESAAKVSGRWFPYGVMEQRGLLLLLAIYLLLDLVIALTVLVIDDMIITGYSSWFWVIEPMVIGTIFVCVACQFLLPLIWATLFKGSHLLRIALGALVAALHTDWLMFWLTWEEDIGDRLQILLYFPMIVLLAYFFAQLPFWGLRWWFSWRVVRPGEETQPLQCVRQLRLIHLFAWPLFIAVPLAIIRVILVEVGYWRFPQIVISLLLTCLIGFVAGLFFLWITLGSRRPVRAALVVIVIGFVLTLACERILAIARWGMTYTPIDWEMLALLGLLALGGTLGALLTIVPTTIIFRSLGWRLAIGRKGWVSGRR